MMFGMVQWFRAASTFLLTFELAVLTTRSVGYIFLSFGTNSY